MEGPKAQTGVIARRPTEGQDSVASMRHGGSTSPAWSPHCKLGQVSSQKLARNSHAAGGSFCSLFLCLEGAGFILGAL